MKFLHKLLIASALITGAAACNKQLDLRPTDTIDETKAYTNVNDLEKGLFGVYAAYGTGLVDGIYIGSILADEVKISNENRGQGQFTFKWQITSGDGDVTGDYSVFYVAIDRANRILAKMNDIQTTTDAEAAQKNRIKGELLAFRGMAHYQLLIRYMPAGYEAGAPGVPIMLESNLLGKPARNTVGEVVNQIAADLGAARGTAEIPDAVANGLRLSKASIAAYQARLSLLTRNWDQAITFANDALTLSGKSVAGRDEYASIWTDESFAEVILRFRNDYAIQTLWRDTNGDVFFEPSDKLKNQYDRATDIRFQTFFGSAGNDTSIVIKYPGSSFGPQINDVKDVRVSEMVLIRAEAYAEKGDLQKAAQDINLIRRNRIEGYADETFASKDAAIAAIVNERFKELPFEGFRFFDLKRRGLGITRLPSDVQSTNWIALNPGDYRFALPIPQEEIFANPNTTQNPGY